MAGRCSEVLAELLAAVRTVTGHNALPCTWTFNIGTLDQFLKWRHHLMLGKKYKNEAKIFFSTRKPGNARYENRLELGQPRSQRVDYGVIPGHQYH